MDEKYFQLWFAAEGTKVRVKIRPVHPLDTFVFSFTMEAGSEAYATLLAHTLTHQMQDRLREIRRRTYERGWRHAKAKRFAKESPAYHLMSWWERPVK